MVIVSRKSLRQHLSMDNLHDGFVGTHRTTLPATIGSAYFQDPFTADLSLTNEARYQRAWLKTQGMKLRIGSFNTASGAFITGQINATTILSGSEYEVHELMDPDDKDHAIDWAINREWVRQEIALNTVDGALFYSVGFDFGQVFDWWIMTNPSGTQDRVPATIPGKPEIRLTGSGRELRLQYGYQASQQIILDAEVRASLGADDSATINIQNEARVLYGAESQCWEMLSKRAPAQERKAYLVNAQRAGLAYSRLSTRFQPQTDRRIGFDEFF